MHDPYTNQETGEPIVRPLPPGMRARLLEILAIGYACNCSQTRLGNAPDAAIAWQVQSMLDDFADYEAKRAWNLDDDHYEASKAVGAT